MRTNIGIDGSNGADHPAVDVVSRLLDRDRDCDFSAFEQGRGLRGFSH